MLKGTLLASCLLLTSLSSYAGLISYAGYERESNSIIVKGGGLEWLKWDQTSNLSINQALLKYAGEGWTIATSQQLANLFNAFKFGKNNWQGAPVYKPWYAEWSNEPYTPSEDSPHNNFISLFGMTSYIPVSKCETPFGSCNPEARVSADAWYRDPGSSIDFIHLASVTDDYIYESSDPRFGFNKSFMSHYAGIGQGRPYSYDRTDQKVALALVRSETKASAPVPGPSTLGLLLVGLVFGIFLRNQPKVN